jgi:hypothetical protein
MSEIDYQEPPFTEILKNDSDHRHTGCASIGMLNCLHLLGILKEQKRSEVLLDLKSSLQEDSESLVVSPTNFKSFLMTTNYFDEVYSSLFFTKDLVLHEFLDILAERTIAFVIVAVPNSSLTHCSVIYIQEGRLMIDGWEADLESLARILFFGEKNFGFYLWRDHG